MPYYGGSIIIGPHLEKWIHALAHRRFASENWVKGQIRFGTWRRRRPRNHFYVIVYDVESRKNVKIEFIHYPNGNSNYPFNHVYADHAHLF